MCVNVIEYPTSSDATDRDRFNNQDSTPIAILLPALSKLRTASRLGLTSNSHPASDRDGCKACRVTPLTPVGKRFSAGRFLKSYLLKQENVSRSKICSDMGSEIADFFNEKIDTPSQWQAILEPCIPPTGAQVSVLRRAPQ